LNKRLENITTEDLEKQLY